MSDVEWYLESAGVRKGPFSARQIIEMMKSGEVSRDALVTTARMQGDWVTVHDLAEAYSELHQKKSVASPISDQDSTSTHIYTPPANGQYQAPPRPIEQLEASRLIVLQQEPEADATDSLFAAIQTIRDKNQAKGNGPANRDRTSEAVRATSDSPFPQQTVLYIAILLLLGVGAYVASRVFRSAGESVVTAPEQEKPQNAAVENPPPTQPASSRMLPVGTAPAMSGNRLLSEGASGVRTAPPVRITPAGRPKVESYRRREPEPEPEIDRELERERERERERFRERGRERDRDASRESIESEHLLEGDAGPEQPPDAETEANPSGMEPGQRLNDPARPGTPPEEVAPEETPN